MKLAFVVRLENTSRPAENFFEGWVEEVDSSTQLKFHSADELLKFLGHRFELTMAANKQSPSATPEQNQIARMVTAKPKSGDDL